MDTIIFISIICKMKCNKNIDYGVALRIRYERYKIATKFRSTIVVICHFITLKTNKKLVNCLENLFRFIKKSENFHGIYFTSSII